MPKGVIDDPWIVKNSTLALQTWALGMYALRVLFSPEFCASLMLDPASHFNVTSARLFQRLFSVFLRKPTLKFKPQPSKQEWPIEELCSLR